MFGQEKSARSGAGVELAYQLAVGGVAFPDGLNARQLRSDGGGKGRFNLLLIKKLDRGGQTIALTLYRLDLDPDSVELLNLLPDPGTTDSQRLPECSSTVESAIRQLMKQRLLDRSHGTVGQGLDAISCATRYSTTRNIS